MRTSLAGGVAVVLLLGGCASSDTGKERDAEKRRQDEAQAAFIAQQDDARCQSYAKPGSDAYAKCRASLSSHRGDVKAIIRGPDSAPEGSK
jgi:hypothetical protein